MAEGFYSVNEMNWRHYDPAIARWVAIDPVTHHSTSPYSAFENNPVYWSDPSGLTVTVNGDKTVITGTDDIANFMNSHFKDQDNGSEANEYETEGGFYNEFSATGNPGGGKDGGR